MQTDEDSREVRADSLNQPQSSHSAASENSSRDLRPVPRNPQATRPSDKERAPNGPTHRLGQGPNDQLSALLDGQAGPIDFDIGDRPRSPPGLRAPRGAPAAVAMRDTPLYRAALELELWKDHQKMLFEKELKEKEFAHMNSLASEWKRREKEREVATKEKLAHCSQLESQLAKSLHDAELREKDIALQQNELVRLRVDLQRERDHLAEEIASRERRIREECDYKVDLERARSRYLEEQIGKLKEQMVDAEKKYYALEREFAEYKRDQSAKPEVRLQTEVNMLTTEKAELERKLAGAIRSKEHYKQQWTRALQELAHLKLREQELARAHLRSQQDQLEHMRLRYLAAEEKELVKNEKRELDDIKEQLKLMREEQQKDKASEKEKSFGYPGYPLSGLSAPVAAGIGSDAWLGSAQAASLRDERIARLLEERETLMRTGVYSANDRVVQELDSEIAARLQAIALAPSVLSPHPHSQRT